MYYNISIKVFFSFLIFLISNNGFSQGKFSFEIEEHDFGTVVEGDKAEKVFKFKNVGNEPIVISNVKASCGCTTPDWPKNPILPGEENSVKAIYNSKGRPGRFFKTITITSNAEEGMKRLTIKGNVTKKEEPLKEGILNVDIDEINLGKVESDKQISKKITLKNTGKDPLKIVSVKSDCRCINYNLSLNPIPISQEATLELLIKPSLNNSENLKVEITTDSELTKNHTIQIDAEIVENINQESIVKENKPIGW